MTTPTGAQRLREAGSVTRKVTGRILQQLELGGPTPFLKSVKYTQANNNQSFPRDPNGIDFHLPDDCDSKN